MSARRSSSGGGLVYSTDRGSMCPRCRRPVGECLCRKRQPPAGDGIVRVRRESKGRGGKQVTVVTGAPLDDRGLVALGKQLKSRCGSGGTVKDGVIEIQGDHRDRIVAELGARGWTVKLAGG